MLNKIFNEDCLEWMKRIPDGSIDLTVTSPPYDNLRTYNGYSFDFEWIAKELYRVTKEWWVVVWVVWDQTIKWSESWTSFKQALFFKEIGFNLHDTMIWQKQTFTAVWALKSRYAPVFEYMFIFTKGKIKTFNPIKDRKNVEFWKKVARNHWIRMADWSLIKNNDAKNNPDKRHNEYWIRFNIWKVNVWKNVSSTDANSFLHPATFPEKLAEDHILSWSNPWDIVLDPFAWSGTTLKMAKKNGRDYIWIEISEEYCNIAQERITKHLCI